MHRLRFWIDPVEAYFFGLYDKAPGALRPYVPYALLALALLLYIWMLIAMGRWSLSKGQRFWYGVSLGVVTGPLFAILFLAFLNDAPARPGGRKAQGRRTRRARRAG